MNNETIIKDPSSSDTRWEFLDGSTRSAVNLRTSFVGIGTYRPGWRWSEHVGKQTGKLSENHIGYILSGSFIVKSANGEESVVGPGEAFELAPGHDAWVNGDQPCVALDFGCNEKHEL
ncbi:MAG: hypothetical protein ACXWFI_12080 [Methylobacter sp.]